MSGLTFWNPSIAVPSKACGGEGGKNENASSAYLQVTDWPAVFVDTNVMCFPVKASFDFFQKLAKDGRSPSAFTSTSAMM